MTSAPPGCHASLRRHRAPHLRRYRTRSETVRRTLSEQVRQAFAALAVVAALSLLAGCQAQQNDRLRDVVIEGTHHGGPAAALAAAGVSASVICVFPPGATADEMASAMGSSWPSAPQIPEASELVVAITPPNVVAWALVPAGSTGTLVETTFGCGPADYIPQS